MSSNCFMYFSLFYSRLPDEWGFPVPTVIQRPQHYGDVTTKANPYATHADYTTNFTG